MATSLSRKNSLYGRIDTREDALMVIKGVAVGFYVLAGIQAAVGLIIAYTMIIDAAVYAVLAFLLAKFASRFVAVLLLLLAVAATAVTINNKMHGGAGGNNYVLALIMTWAAVRGVQATFFLQRGKKAKR